MNGSKHDIGISIAKAVCIIAMVVGHSGCPGWLERFIYLFHMPCFFIISGFLLQEAHVADWRRSISRRVTSLWWHFVKWSVIFVLLHNLFVTLYLESRTYSLSDMMQRIGVAFAMGWGESMLGGFWFLRELLIASVVTLAVLALCRHLSCLDKAYRYAWLICLGLVAAAVAVDMTGLYNTLVRKTTLLAMAYFVAGVYLRYLCDKLPNINKLPSRIAILPPLGCGDGLRGCTVGMVQLVDV